MSRLVSELGADVIDDTPKKPRKVDPHKRNFIIGFAALGVAAVAIGMVYYFATTDWLSDYSNMSYITYGINTEPDTEGIYAGQITASIVSVDSRSNYPSSFLVPKQIKGHPISRIEANAFQGCVRMKSVTLQDNITSIGEEAFINCQNLSKIRFSKNLKSIGNNAFEGTAYLNSWKDNEYVQANGILLYVNESRLLNDNSATSLIFVNDANSQYVNDYPGSIALSLKSISVVTGGKENEKVSITNWMDGIFKNFSHLKFVETPTYLNGIPANSFEGCTALEKVIVSDGTEFIGNSVFEDCISLESITIPTSITSIGSYSFAGDEKLVINSLHEGVKSIGVGIFQNCESITNFTIPASISVIPSCAFDRTKLNNITFTSGGSSITDIGDFAFNQTEFTEFTFPKNTGYIASGVLKNCPNLERVYAYDNGPARMETSAFAGSNNFHSLKTLDASGNVLAECNDDDTVYFPSTIRRTDNGGGHQFENTLVKHAVINANINSIGSYMFKDCALLEDVTFKNGCILRTVDEGAFENCVKLEEVIFPKLVKTIGVGTFLNCSSLKDVELPDSEQWTDQDLRVVTKKGSILPSYYTTIKENLFEGCTSLENVTIPRSVTKISDYSFKNCSSLKSLFIPSSVSSISNGAFEGCDNLYLALEASSVPGGFASNWNSGLKGYSFAAHEILENEDYVYALNKDNATLTIVDYKGENIPETLTIPSEIGGKKVTCIKENFLNGNEEVKNVVLPNSITSVGKGAFEICPNLVYSKVENGFKYLKSASNDYAALVESATFENPEEATFIINKNVRCAKAEAFTNPQINFNVENDINYLPSEDNELFALIKVTTNKTTIVRVNEATEFIAESAFVGLTKLESVVLADNVKTVGKGAFNANTKFSVYSKSESQPEGWDFDWNIAHTHVYWSTLGPVSLDGYKGLSACLNLDNTIRLTAASSGEREIVIPAQGTYKNDEGTSITADITMIDTGFLSSNSYIMSVYIPASIPTIKEAAFDNCENLVIYSEAASKLAGWDDNWVDEHTPVYYGVTKTTNYALIDSVEYAIKDGKAVVSGHDEKIKYAVIPSSVEIGGTTYAVESIGPRAFANASMTSIYIPSSVKSISDTSFESCNAVTVYFEGNATPNFTDYYSRPVYTNVARSDIYSSNYIEYLINKNTGEATATSYIFGLTNASIPDTITVESIEYKVTTVGSRAFQGCTELRRASFGANVTFIGDYAFQGCKGLDEYIVIPEAVTYVGDWAFSQTNSKLTIYVEANQIPSEWAEEWAVFDYDTKSDDDSLTELDVYIGLNTGWAYDKNNTPYPITDETSNG